MIKSPSSEYMNGIIFAAGFGTRLRPHSNAIPKPLFPFLDKKLIELSIEFLRELDLRKIFINVHYKADEMISFLESKDFGIDIEISKEESILGSAATLVNLKQSLKSDDFVTINPDTIHRPDMEKLISDHKRSSAFSTISLVSADLDHSYTPIFLNSNSKISGFAEFRNPDFSNKDRRTLFSGISIHSPELVEYLERIDNNDLSIAFKNLFKIDKLAGRIDKAKYFDLGTVTGYCKTVMEFMQNTDLTPVKLWADAKAIKIYPPVFIEPGSDIASNISIGPFVSVHRGSKIQKNVEISHSILLPGSFVSEGKIVKDKLLSSEGESELPKVCKDLV